MTELSSRITAFTEPLAASLGLTVWGVEALLGKRSIIRVYVEREGGVSIDQCAELSRLLGLTLEVEDAVEHAYILEVSSPGLERVFFTLEQLNAAQGKDVELALHKAVADFPGRRKFIGTLAQVTGTDVVLELEPALVLKDQPALLTVTYENIKKARQVLVVPDKTPPGKKREKKVDKEKKPSDARNDTIKEGAEAEGLI